jgi:hypothetical protein
MIFINIYDYLLCNCIKFQIDFGLSTYCLKINKNLFQDSIYDLINKLQILWFLHILNNI